MLANNAEELNCTTERRSQNPEVGLMPVYLMDLELGMLSWQEIPETIRQ
jgi:hypothetical protein